MPASAARLAARVSGSFRYDSNTPEADREIDDADVVGGPDRDGVVDRRDHIADVAITLAVEHLQAEQLRARRDARAAAVRVVAAAAR